MRKLNIADMHRISVGEFKQSVKTPLVVVLDNVRSTYNVGSIFRTADAFRIQSLLLCGITPQPPHPEIHKTALGAEMSVDWSYSHSALQSVDLLKQQGFLVLAVEQVEGSISLSDLSDEIGGLQTKFHLGGKVAIVVGNEVKGVEQTVVDQCHACIEIPQFGTKHSLNVCNAAAIVMWQLFTLLSGQSRL